jgi:hypothetical protein
MLQPPKVTRRKSIMTLITVLAASVCAAGAHGLHAKAHRLGCTHSAAPRETRADPAHTTEPPPPCAVDTPTRTVLPSSGPLPPSPGRYPQ